MTGWKYGFSKLKYMMVFLPPRLERCLNTKLYSPMLLKTKTYLAAWLNANPVIMVASASG